MTIYDRPDELVTAEGALAGEVLDFPDIARGWGITFEQTGGLPPVEWMNGLFRRIDRATRYFMQRGLPEWSETEDYPLGAYVQYAGNAYLSKRANTNKQPGAGGSSNDWGRWSITRDEFDTKSPSRRVLGLRGNQNAGSPLTKIDLSADLVTSVDGAGAATNETAVAVATLDLGLAGPAANGRDQAAAFAAGSWINVFRIYNPTTGAGAWTASTAAPTAGPALPAGFTRWAYATTLRWNAASNLVPCLVEGNTIVYDLVDNSVNRVISGGTATVMTAIDCSAYVPPNALRANFIANLTVNGGITTVNAFVRRNGSAHSGQNVVSGTIQVAGSTITAINWTDIPLGGQKFDYRLSITPAGGGFSAEVRGYVVANGDS